MILNIRRKQLIKESMQDYAIINRILTNEIAEMNLEMIKC